MAADIIAAIGQVPLFSELLSEQLQWIIDHGQQVWLQAGDMHRSEGEPAEHVFVMLEGEIRVFQQFGDEERTLVVYGTHTLFGELPVLLGIDTFFASGRALRPCHVLELPNAVFWEMLVRFPSVGVGVLRIMAQRIRELEALGQGRARLTELGALGEGLAHEGSAPARAAQHAARQLRAAQVAVQTAAVKLQTAAAIPADTLVAIRRDALAHALAAPAGSSVEHHKREQELQAWLTTQSIPSTNWATVFVTTGLDVGWFTDLVSRAPAQSLVLVIEWLHACLALDTLLTTVDASAQRLATLVDTVKSYAYMDQAPRQQINIHDGLESTLLILSAKLRAKNVVVQRQYDRSVPSIFAYGSELNQAWTNLIEYTLHVVDTAGMITIVTACDDGHLLVEIANDGPGISPEAPARFWEPSYTTRDVGQSAGRSLMLTHRTIVGRHQGDIRVVSRPGDMRVQVRLPLAP